MFQFFINSWDIFYGLSLIWSSLYIYILLNSWDIFLCLSLIRRRKQGGGLCRPSPPGSFYGFQGVFRPQWVLFGGHGITRKFKPPLENSCVRPFSLIYVYIYIYITIRFLTKLFLNISNKYLIRSLGVVKEHRVY